MAVPSAAVSGLSAFVLLPRYLHLLSHHPIPGLPYKTTPLLHVNSTVQTLFAYLMTESRDLRDPLNPTTQSLSCNTCKARKRKCNKQKPNCSLCSRLVDAGRNNKNPHVLTIATVKGWLASIHLLRHLLVARMIEHSLVYRHIHLHYQAQQPRKELTLGSVQSRFLGHVLRVPPHGQFLQIFQPCCI